MNPSPSLFIPASFFMIRIPVFPIEKWRAVLNREKTNDLITLFFHDLLIREAIFIASPTLYDGLVHFNEKNQKKRDQLISSFRKYLLRMSSRATPFGLFSFVTTGKFDAVSMGKFNHHTLKKRTRPDMEWTLNVINMICSEKENFLKLPVRANPLVYLSRNRLYLNAFRKKSDDKEERVISLRANRLTLKILDLTKQVITVRELLTEIEKAFPGIELLKTQEVIQILLEKQLLEVGLLPSSFQTDYYRLLLKAIDQYDLTFQHLNALHQIQHTIQSYDQLPLGLGEQVVKELNDLMKGVAKTSNTLQVDLFYAKKPFKLPHQMREELGEATTFIWKLSSIISEKKPHHLERYTEKFLEKYGLNRIVPLLELLDQNELGIPKHYQNENEIMKQQQPLMSAWMHYLYGQWGLCISEEKKEIVIGEEIFRDLDHTTFAFEKASLSFDLFCKVLAPSEQSIDQGKYTLYLFGNSEKAGNIFGRFLDILGKETQSDLKNLFLQEEKIEKDCQYIQVAYLPKEGRHGNITLHPKLYDHFLDLEGENGFELSQIYVGVNEKGLYLTDQEGKLEKVFLFCHALNMRKAPFPLRFLRDVSLSRFQSMEFSFWGELISAPYRPRLRYKKVILSKAEWTIHLKMLKLNQHVSFKKIEHACILWMKKWKVDRFVYLSRGDQQILIDIENKEDIKEIVKQLKKDASITLIEHEHTTEIGWVQSSDQQAYQAELVIPFVKNPSFHQNDSPSPRPKYYAYDYQSRFKTIGTEYFFLKLYMAKEEQQRFLLTTLSHFVNHLIDQKIIEKWFFIRYVDPDDHIRIRFYGKKEAMHSSLIQMLSNWSQLLFQHKFIKDLQIGTYEREIERYGGEMLIDVIEAFFCADTETCIELMHLLHGQKTSFPNYVLSAISLVDLVKNMRSLKQDFLFSFDREGLEGIRLWEDQITSTLSHLFSDQSIESQKEEIKIIQQALLKRADSLRCLVKQMQYCASQNQLIGSPTSILESLIHMHCNRLMGINHNLEKKARAYAQRMLFRFGRVFQTAYDST